MRLDQGKARKSSDENNYHARVEDADAVVLDAEDDLRGKFVRKGLLAWVERRTEVWPVARIVQVNVLAILVALALQLHPSVLKRILQLGHLVSGAGF